MIYKTRARFRSEVKDILSENDNLIALMSFVSRDTFVRLQAILCVQELPERLHLLLLTHAALSDERKLHVSSLILRTHFEIARQARVPDVTSALGYGTSV